MELDRRRFIAGLGGAAAVGLMSHEARADALEGFLNAELSDTASSASGGGFPTAAEVQAQISSRTYRSGIGQMFMPDRGNSTVARLAEMPERPQLLDFFEMRFNRTRNHCLQSATKAVQRGVDEEIVLACLLHDVSQELLRTEHGYWGAQMFEPYVPERTAFAIRYHQPLRFFADDEAGYQYPDLYRRVFGYDYVPAPHIQAAYDFTRKHRWYGAAREVTVSDLYAFDPNAVVSIEPFVDIIGRHFRAPAEGLGFDGSPVAHMWRTINFPDAPL
ncbi:MAG: hypothetical protein H6978_02410 [Gammaproteobacteria bacterium]|nr:hypothetical protein [Gammaproteobacteria bacterium]